MVQRPLRVALAHADVNVSVEVQGVNRNVAVEVQRARAILDGIDDVKVTVRAGTIASPDHGPDGGGDSTDVAALSRTGSSGRLAAAGSGRSASGLAAAMPTPTPSGEDRLAADEVMEAVCQQRQPQRQRGDGVAIKFCPKALRWRDSSGRFAKAPKPLTEKQAAFVLQCKEEAAERAAALQHV